MIRSALKRPTGEWLEKILLVVGVVCLGIFLWSWLDARVFEARQEEVLEQTLARHYRAVPAKGKPASETDTLSSFRRTEKKLESPPPDEGELLGRIRIPRVDITAVVVEGVGKKSLRRAAGHIPGTALPSEDDGNVGIAAHRDSFFRGLKDIRKDDTIELTTLDGIQRYRVEWTKIVQPTDTSVLAPTDGPVLTLVTCYPFYYVGSAPKRFVVRAHRIEEEGTAGS
ncbi:MAG TPA: class D sortase [Thermoanaerobaculia bacterium]|jgi:sortase A|nr:class D sortase [Thermoanaerobaculia bacterium]